MRFCNSALTPLVFILFCWHIDCSCLLSSVERVRSSCRISLFEEEAIAATAVTTKFHPTTAAGAVSGAAALGLCSYGPRQVREDDKAATACLGVMEKAWEGSGLRPLQFDRQPTLNFNHFKPQYQLSRPRSCIQEVSLRSKVRGKKDGSRRACVRDTSSTTQESTGSVSQSKGRTPAFLNKVPRWIGVDSGLVLRWIRSSECQGRRKTRSR
ncbi:hypothetical protein F5B22DRAFT_302208 [Xylaria bambusicola]|uniref:uncharacterized protein n=1 Tax=Xylaria bambusicola TaxID=326684 RepID=UPI0020083EAD|nr:uncharacterized protein F5B22DRAFT_302208 [Xylaria bambusicola]KAI0512688.1 hypothetical protein F5B22DRAFT_302208 [Xylaria bambusicola]